MKWKRYLFFPAIILLVLLAAFMSSQPAEPGFESARELIVLRKIAHEVLRSTGDSISRIPPIQQLSDTEFRIRFENSFSFEPDSLVQTIHQVMNDHALGEKYIVNVLEPSTGEVVFGYAMLGKGQDNIVPCLGREQLARNYTILIRLAKNKFPVSRFLIWTAAGLAAAFLLYFLLQYRKQAAGLADVSLATDTPGTTDTPVTQDLSGTKGTPGNPEIPGQLVTPAPPNNLGSPDNQGSPDNLVQPDFLQPANNPGPPEARPVEEGVRIGSYRFVPAERLLFLDGEKTELTAKEARLLEIFGRQLNQVIDRKQLQKEVWEDEGVIVGRSLDMFISRIRKKLDRDPSLKLINIHGKGYKLEVGDPE